MALSHRRKKSRSAFSTWLGQNSSFFYTQFIAFLGFIGVLLDIVLHVRDFLKPGVQAIEKGTIIAILLLQQIFIVIVIFVLNRKTFSGKIQIDRFAIYHKRLLNEDLTLDEKEAARIVCRLNTSIFGRYWFLFWKWIFLLYTVLFTRYIIDHFFEKYAIYNICANVLETFLNSFSMAYIFICFIVIHSPLNSLDYDGDAITCKLIKFFKNRDLSLSVVKGFSVFHFFALSVYFVARLHSHLVLDQVELTKLSNYNTLFKAASGIFNCVALALLIARLDSKIINVPSNLISVLILYAAVQPLYAYFDDPKQLFIVLCVSAFTLACKVYFYVIIAFILNTGRLADLFMTFPMIKVLVEREGYGQKNGNRLGLEKTKGEVQAFINLLKFIEIRLHTAAFKSTFVD